MCPLWPSLSRPLLAVGLALVLTAGARADLIVANPNFDIPNPSASTTTLTGAHHGGSSAAASWTTWNNSLATTTTSLLPSTLSVGGTEMIHVTTTGGSNGIVQTLAPLNTGPTSVTTSAFVYVLSGRVSLGTGNGGSTTADVVSTTTHTWELLRAANGTSPANEITVYSYKGAADYYVGLVSVANGVHTATVPEPSTLLSSLVGVVLSAFGLGRWRQGA